MKILFFDEPDGARTPVRNFEQRLKATLSTEVLDRRCSLDDEQTWDRRRQEGPFLVFLHLHFLASDMSEGLLNPDCWSRQLTDRAVFILYSEARDGISSVDAQRLRSAAQRADLRLEDGRSRLFVYRDKIRFDDELLEAAMRLASRIQRDAEQDAGLLSGRYYLASELGVKSLSDRLEMHHGLAVLFGHYRMYLGDRDGAIEARDSLAALGRMLLEAAPSVSSLSYEVTKARFTEVERQSDLVSETLTVEALAKLRDLILGDLGSPGIIDSIEGALRESTNVVKD